MLGTNFPDEPAFVLDDREIRFIESSSAPDSQGRPDRRYVVREKPSEKQREKVSLLLLLVLAKSGIGLCPAPGKLRCVGDTLVLIGETNGIPKLSKKRFPFAVIHNVSNSDSRLKIRSPSDLKAAAACSSPTRLATSAAKSYASAFQGAI